MDAKALAKSKRAHTLNHKKKHHTHQGLKASSVGSDDKKTAGKAAKEKPQQPHGQKSKEKAPQSQGSRGLPSNWDRYGEDFDLATGEAQGSSSQPTEFVIPKSKGADYAYLISEAKGQSQSQYCSDVLPLFDDFIRDFTQDFGPMLAAKGQNLLSWTTADSFEFEDEASTTLEVPFLSMNLNALAEQLAKAKLSERLYLQSDLLPLELLDEACEDDKNDLQTHTSFLGDNLGASKNVQPNGEPGSDLGQTSKEEPKPIVKQNPVEILQSQEIKRSNPVVAGEAPLFEATSAEAELDMLLNSFNETTILEPSAADASGESMKRGTHMDDVIDMLLEETSIVEDEKAKISSSMNSNSQILDDFDTWLDTI